MQSSAMCWPTRHGDSTLTKTAPITGISGQKSVSQAHYKYYVFVRPERLASGWTRDCIIAEINARHIPCFVGSCSESILRPRFDGTEFRSASPLETTRQLAETTLLFLLHPTLAERDTPDTRHVGSQVMALASR